MRVHAHNEEHRFRFKVLDAESGEEIPNVIWADDETGQYCQHQTDSRGIPMYEGDESVTVLRKGNIRLVDIRTQEPST